MEGLDVSEMSLSKANFAHVDFRIDSEFYSQPNLQKEDAVRRGRHASLGSLCKLIAGPFGSAITTDNYDSEGGCRYIRATDIKSFFLNDRAPIFVGEDTYNKFPQFHLKEKDILLTVVGMNFGVPAIIEKEDCPAIFSCKSTLVRDCSVNPYYLVTYLSTDIGYGLVRRGYRGAAQPGINLSDIENVLVPIVSENFQNEIEVLVKRSRSFVAESHASYLAAESILLNTLGMASFSSCSENINVKPLSDSFLATGRLDAEYYQPKYEQLISHIEAQPHEHLAKLVSITKSIEPGSDAYSDNEEGLPFLRVADYSKFGVTKPQINLNVSYVAENQEELDLLKPKKNTILFSKDGSVGEAYCLPEDANFVTSGAVLHLSVLDTEKILPDYLALTLNSVLVKMQAERDAGGSIILHWRVSEIENVIVPLVEFSEQQKISSLVGRSFAFKAESDRLLEIAKQAVRIAIEGSEAMALTYLRGTI